MKVNYCGGAAQERMERNGWRMELPISYAETPEQMYKRLSNRYRDVRVYWVGTMIRGLHSYFALCK